MASSGPGLNRVPGRALRCGGLRGTLPGYVHDHLGLPRNSARGRGPRGSWKGGFPHPRPGTLTSGHAPIELTAKPAPGSCKCGGSPRMRNKVPGGPPRSTSRGSTRPTPWRTLKPGGSDPHCTSKNGTTPGSHSFGRCKRLSQRSWMRRKRGVSDPRKGTQQTAIGSCGGPPRGRGCGEAQSRTCRRVKCALGAHIWWSPQKAGDTGASTAGGTLRLRMPGGPWSSCRVGRSQASSRTRWGAWPGSDGTRPSSSAGTGGGGRRPQLRPVRPLQASKQDGRYICLDCGRHCFKWKELVAKPCLGVPQRPKYARALQQVQAGQELSRSAVRRDAKYQAGHTAAAAGRRTKGFDAGGLSNAPRKLGPAHPEFRGRVPAGSHDEGQGQAAAQPGQGPQGAPPGQRPPGLVRGDIRDLLGLRPAAPQEARSQGAGGGRKGPGAPPNPHGGMGPAVPAGEPPVRRVPPNQRPLRRGRGRAVPPSAGLDIRQLLRPRPEEPPGSPHPGSPGGAGRRTYRNRYRCLRGRRGATQPQGGDATQPSLPGAEGGDEPRGARDAARGPLPGLQGPEGRGFFLLPPPILGLGEGLARAGTDLGPAAGAAGSSRLTVLDMLGAVMPREPD